MKVTLSLKVSKFWTSKNLPSLAHIDIKRLLSKVTLSSKDWLWLKEFRLWDRLVHCFFYGRHRYLLFVVKKLLRYMHVCTCVSCCRVRVFTLRWILSNYISSFNFRKKCWKNCLKIRFAVFKIVFLCWNDYYPIKHINDLQIFTDKTRAC
jgi:hypothetical protein